MSLIEITSIVRHKGYDYYILDNAPTGHLLRFFELPELMQDWLRIFFLLIAPTVTQHLGILARISRVLRDPKLRQNLLSADSAERVVANIRDAEGKL